MLSLLTRKMWGLKGRLHSKLAGAVQGYKQARIFRRTVVPYPSTIYLAVNTRCGFACKMSAAGIRALDDWKRQLGRDYPKIGINYALSNHNYHCLEPFMAAVHALPVDQITFSHMNYVTARTAEVHNARFGHLYPATVSSVSNADPTKVEVEVLWEQIQRVKARYPNRVGFGPDLDRQGLEDFYFHPEGFVRGDRCYVPWRAGEIISQGDCVVMTRRLHLNF